MLYLIDSHSLIHRCFHAIPPLTTPDGRPAGALYGLANIMLRLTDDKTFTHAVACFDRPEPTFRKERYEAYKGTRPETPDGLIPQLQEAHTLMERFGVRTIDAKGYEADDCIATLARRFEEESEVVILTGDMDTLQLVNKSVTVRAFKSGIKETITYDEQGVIERIGVPPTSAIPWKALVGDQSDNIPGVQGIGPKTAADLLERYKTLEGIYANLKEIPEKTREKLSAGKEAAFFAESLVRLDTAVPIPKEPLAHYEVKRDDEMIRAYAESLGFMRLVSRMHKETPPPQESPKTRKKQGDHAGQTRMF